MEDHSNVELIPHDWELRLAVYHHIVATGEAPSVLELATVTGESESWVVAGLHRLGAHHHLAMAPGSNAIWMAHPFSAVPTTFPVETDQCRYWGNCAWDAFGIPALLNRDSRTMTRCAETNEAVELGVENGRLRSSDGIVHFVVQPSDFWRNVGFT